MSESSKFTRIVAAVKSTRTRALLSLGIVLGLTSVSTLAFWTDSSQLTSGTIQTAKLDLKLDGADNLPSSTKLAISSMIPGESVAATISVQRAANTIAFTYSATAQVATANELTDALRFKVFTGTAGAVSTAAGTGIRTQTCGGTQIFGDADGAKLTAAATTLVSARAALATPLALQGADLTDNLCVQAILPTSTGNGAQAKSATVNFTFNATQLTS